VEIGTIQIFIKLLSVFIGAGVFGLIISIVMAYQPQKLILRAYEEFNQQIRSRKGLLLDYRKMELFLQKNGAAYHYGTWMKPVGYLALRLVMGCVGLMMGIYFGTVYGILLAILLFISPRILLVYLNGRDNERLLPELKLLYNALEMQIRAGVYVTDALTECYGSVQEERLRVALLELSGDIVMKSDLDDALERFQGKFDNRYVDTLCITLLQALESGQAIDLLSDIAEQIKDMEVAVMSRKKSALDRSVTFYQLGILTVILGIVLYACVTHMFLSATIF
jgi:Flp pilus assembly protein TadB